ncbi:MAG: copper amine oxidase N-terminal domain-containing protein [Bacillota bacterium]
MVRRLRACTISAFVAILILFAGGIAPAAAAITVKIDGQRLSFGLDPSPQIIQGRTLVPLRAIFEALGAEVQWQATTQTVIATKGSTTITLCVGQREALRNTEKITLDVPAMIIKGRTMVPLRFVSEALGTNVSWDGESQTVRISTREEQQPSGNPDAEGSFTPGQRLELTVNINTKVDFQVIFEPDALAKAGSVKVYADSGTSCRLVLGADVNTASLPGKKGFDGARVKFKYIEKWPFGVERPVILANGDMTGNKCWMGKEEIVAGVKILERDSILRVMNATDAQWSQVQIAY